MENIKKLSDQIDIKKFDRNKEYISEISLSIKKDYLFNENVITISTEDIGSRGCSGSTCGRYREKDFHIALKDFMIMREMYLESLKQKSDALEQTQADNKKEGE